MSKQNALADLMVKLSMDPSLRRRFQEDPSAVLGEVELSEEELSLLAGGNPDQIRDYLGGDAPAECFLLFSTE
ncbi:MAG TPA: hypothetical protein VF789_34540 [Thermoanaerobaculia bacterium]